MNHAIRTLVVLVMLVFVGACSPKNPGVLTLRDRLWAVTDEALDANKATPIGATRSDLYRLADKAASRLDSDGASPDMVRAAEEELRNLIFRMAESARRRGSSGGTREVVNVDESDLEVAKVCPLYPFC